MTAPSAVAAGVIDSGRLAVIGQSNGGGAVNLVVTATGRFRAAVASAGMSDLVSFFGQLWMDSRAQAYTAETTVVAARGEATWEGDGLMRDSPVRRLDRVTTPLLLVAGRDDTVVGFGQTAEMFTGLNYLGKDVTLLA